MIIIMLKQSLKYYKLRDAILVSYLNNKISKKVAQMTMRGYKNYKRFNKKNRQSFLEQYKIE
jgi:hypothetical protein